MLRVPPRVTNSRRSFAGGTYTANVRPISAPTLVADVVTGKLDVRAAAAKLPAEPEDSTPEFDEAEIDDSTDSEVEQPA